MDKIQLFLKKFSEMTFKGKGAFWGICLAVLILVLVYLFSDRIRKWVKNRTKPLILVPVLMLAVFTVLFINTCNYVPLDSRTPEEAYVWEQLTKSSKNDLAYQTDVKNPAAGKAYEQTYASADILGHLTSKEPSEFVSSDYTFVSTDGATGITFLTDGTYRVRVSEGEAEETGKYAYADKVLTLTSDADGAETKVGKTSTKLRYTAALTDPATGKAYQQEYSIKGFRELFVIETSVESVAEEVTVTSADGSTALTFRPDGTYSFAALDGGAEETGRYVYRNKTLMMSNSEGKEAFWKNFRLQAGWLVFAVFVAVAMTLIFVYNARIKRFMSKHPLVWLIIPAALLIYFVYVAIGWNIWVSVSDWGQTEDKINASYGWGGFGQYVKMFNDPDFWNAVLNTLKLFMIIPICLLLGIVLGLIMDQKLKGTAVFRTLILLPFALSFVVTGLIWQQMFNGNGGILVEFFKLLGITENIQWTGDNTLVMYSIMLVMVWQFSGYVAVIFLAAIKNVPTNIINAAKLDGAYMPRIYRKMVIPQLTGAMGSCITILAMYALRSFDLIYSLTSYTNPASTTLPIMMYNQMYAHNNYAYAAAISCFLLALVLVLILPLTYLTNRRKG